MQVGESSKINCGPNETHFPSEYPPISRKLSSVFKTSNKSALSSGILHLLVLRAQIFLFRGTFTRTAPTGYPSRSPWHTGLLVPIVTVRFSGELPLRVTFGSDRTAVSPHAADCFDCAGAHSSC